MGSQPDRRRLGRKRNWRVARLAAATALATLLVNAPHVGAAHTLGTLDCGAAGTYAVDGRSALPAGFDAPGPWSGLFLLEGTTQVFRALSIEGQAFPFSRPSAHRFPGDVITCTLTSSGPMFPNPWTLEGVLIP
jgi:hypothetical protein